jgi:hypothetical protein
MNKIKGYILHACVTIAILLMPFSFIAPKTSYYLAFQSFVIERTWWRLFQKRVVRTKFDIYVFITLNGKWVIDKTSQTTYLKLTLKWQQESSDNNHEDDKSCQCHIEYKKNPSSSPYK